MYEGFTGQARKAMQLAHQEARRHGHDWIGTAHILLGVLREGPDGAAKLLAHLAIDVEALCRAVESQLPPPAESRPGWDRLPLTPAARRTLEYAREEAVQLHHFPVGTEHLVLGLAREPDSEAAQALQASGATLKAMRDIVKESPAASNRDWMLGQAPRGGATAADPSAGDLEAVVTTEAVPATVGDAQDLLSGRRALLNPETFRRKPDYASYDLPVVLMQLRFLQLGAAGAVGFMLGSVHEAPYGALVGLAIGLAVAAVRSSWLGALVGAFAGGYHGSIIGGLGGFLLGLCLGDWRNKRRGSV
jgi:hypothetical protein